MNDEQEHRTASIVRVPGSGLTVARASLVRRGLDLTKQSSEVTVWAADGSEMICVAEGEFPVGITEEEARQWQQEFGEDLESCMRSTPSHRGLSGCLLHRTLPRHTRAVRPVRAGDRPSCAFSRC